MACGIELKPTWDFSVNFRVPPERRASVSGEGEEAPKGLGRRLGGGRRTCSPGRRRAAPQAVADGPSPSRLLWSREAPPFLCFSAPLPLCVKIPLGWVWVGAGFQCRRSRFQRLSMLKYPSSFWFDWPISPIIYP